MSVSQPEVELGGIPDVPAVSARRWPEGRRGYVDRARTLTGRLLLGIGLTIALFLAYEYLCTGTLEARSQRALLTEFRHRVTGGNFDSLHQPVAGGPVALLMIPSLGVHQVVVEGSGVDQLHDGPGHLPGTSLPGEFGNSVILGHRTTWGAPFANLANLRPGDHIVAVTGQGRFVYRVRGIRDVAGGTSDVVGPALASRLTLVTSQSVQSGSRVAVVAKLIGRPLGIPRRPPVPLASDELGLTGDPTGLLLAIIWGQLLAVGLWATGRFYRLWPRGVAYLLTTPPLVAVLWLVFRNLDRFLPGTL